MSEGIPCDARQGTFGSLLCHTIDEALEILVAHHLHRSSAPLQTLMLHYANSPICDESTDSSIHTTSHASTNIMVLGVNPFEDLPGYQLLGLLADEPCYHMHAVDDSTVAIDILRAAGATIHHVPHPSTNIDRYIHSILALCQRFDIHILCPGTDAHLAALASASSRHPRLLSLWPPMAFLSRNSLYNKWALQDWLQTTLHVPQRWAYADADDILRWTNTSDCSFPVMVKGMAKGALRCRTADELPFARSALLENPANRGPFGGTFLEAEVDGPERSVLLVTNVSREVVGCVAIRKLATTQLGTTLVAEVEPVSDLGINLDNLLDRLDAPAVVELESRRCTNGRSQVFEANFRFPSWIGALGDYGRFLVNAFLAAVLPDRIGPSAPLPPPAAGTLLYRLPESGVLSLGQTVRSCNSEQVWLDRPGGSRGGPPLLWPAASPHQFLTK